MRNLHALREHLFDVIELLKTNKIEVEEAKAITQTAQTIINSAKVEVDFLKLRGDKATESEFLKIGK